MCVWFEKDSKRIFCLWNKQDDFLHYSTVERSTASVSQETALVKWTVPKISPQWLFFLLSQQLDLPSSNTFSQARCSFISTDLCQHRRMNEAESNPAMCMRHSGYIPRVSYTVHSIKLCSLFGSLLKIFEQFHWEQACIFPLVNWEVINTKATQVA